MFSNGMNLRRKVAAVGAAILMPLGLAACGGAADDAAATDAGTAATKIVVGGSDAGIAALMIPAIQQAGKENGIQIEFKPMAQSTAQIALLNGDIDMGFMSFVNMASAADQGKKVVALAPTWAANTSMVVKSDSPFKTVEDLKGKRIATLHRTISVYAEAHAVLSDMGYDMEKDFTPFIVDSGGLLQGLLDKGEVDAITQYEPNTTRMLDAGGYREIFHTSKYWEAKGEALAPSQNWAARADWVEKQDLTLLKKIAKRATEIASTDRKLYDQQSKSVNITSKSGLDLLFERFGSLLIADYNVENLKVAQKQLDEAHDAGLTKKDHDINDFIAGS